ncbi:MULTISPECIES: hypothetical protein [Aneurinibacillus]|jgi:hypothetical protein|uniref:Uncharacterized protein n=1 Tax=Aneurinibacillus danicus TaxID=267746 RepID=A0A511VHY4_9BACL|nr:MULTISPECIES: hypothetical protein [Aneurinibacillus]GEN36782.1 hypothetical protein ADA01nite_42420 [Aneurinibacillus danicus]
MNWIAKQWHNAWANYYASKIESLDSSEDRYDADVRTYHSKKFISHYEALYGAEQQNQASDESMRIF